MRSVTCCSVVLLQFTYFSAHLCCVTDIRTWKKKKPRPLLDSCQSLSSLPAPRIVEAQNPKLVYPAWPVLPAQVCKNCGTQSTPFWRKDKADGKPLCNACGLYFSKNESHRPKVGQSCLHVLENRQTCQCLAANRLEEQST